MRKTHFDTVPLEEALDCAAQEKSYKNTDLESAGDTSLAASSIGQQRTFLGQSTLCHGVSSPKQFLF